MFEVKEVGVGGVGVPKFDSVVIDWAPVGYGSCKEAVGYGEGADLAVEGSGFVDGGAVY